MVLWCRLSSAPSQFNAEIECDRLRWEYLVPYTVLAPPEWDPADPALSQPAGPHASGWHDSKETMWHLQIQRRLKRVLQEFAETRRFDQASSGESASSIASCVAPRATFRHDFCLLPQRTRRVFPSNVAIRY